jgi:hypothetical protein
MAKDTAHVSVLEVGSGTNEIVLNDLQVICPMECYTTIENFFSLNPDNYFFKVFIRSSHNLPWVEAKHLNNWVTGDKYFYDIYKNTVWILAENEQKVDVMISY